VTLATFAPFPRKHSSSSTFCTACCVADERKKNNPWRATTLEWSIASPAPEGNFGDVPPVVYRGAYDFHGDSDLDFVPQHLAPELPAGKAH